MNNISKHYDDLIENENDPVHDPKPLRDYMDQWDGDAFIQKMELNLCKRVLEIGVGTGRLALRTAPFCRQFFGIDLSPKTIRRAKEHLSDYQNTTFICGDFLTTDFLCSFDVIYSSLTFMHIREKQKAFDKVCHLLNRGGIFALSIDKNQNNTLRVDESEITIYPDTPDQIISYVNHTSLVIKDQYETEFAHIFILSKID